MTELMGERGRQGAAPLGGHTPGPWEWDTEQDAGEWGDRGPRLESAVLGKAWDEFWGPDGMGQGKNREEAPPIPTILEGWGHDAWGIHCDNPADARLIAAAPELLEVLENLVAAPLLRAIADAPGVIRAKEAIAKARGEQ